MEQPYRWGMNVLDMNFVSVWESKRLAQDVTRTIETRIFSRGTWAFLSDRRDELKVAHFNILVHLPLYNLFINTFFLSNVDNLYTFMLFTVTLTLLKKEAFLISWFYTERQRQYKVTLNCSKTASRAKGM